MGQIKISNKQAQRLKLKSGEWKQYKAIKIHQLGAGALYKEDEKLSDWVNQQPLEENSYACLKFRNYLKKHQSRIPNYKACQKLGITIGSGQVESLIKQISSRMKIVGSQWKESNVSQMLKLRCTYLNGDFRVSISA